MDKHGWKIIHKSMMFPPWLRGFSTIDEPASFHLWPKVCKVCPGEKKLKNTETQMAKITLKNPGLRNPMCRNCMKLPHEPWSILTIWLMVIPSIIRIQK
jgi:hypothetical protein